MNFAKLNDGAIVAARKSANMLAAGGTVIETKVGLWWRTDGYDDKVPVPVTESVE
ncbi:MAG: hypothetical protein ACXW5U_06975 [Thermoanaerobaculia bacterium]